MEICGSRLSPFALCLLGWFGFFFFYPEQIMHRSDAAIKKGHKLAFSGPE